VTDDVRTLAIKLPRDVRRLGVREFWLAHLEPRASEDDKRVEGDFSDLERDMLALAATTPAVSPPRISPQVSPGSPGRDASGERLRHKREKGRLRQARRLMRRSGHGSSR
jgi:hypothetical protein